MSDDKKRDRALQRRVRERQAKTGESYQTAWRQLTADATQDPSSKPETPKTARRVPLPMGTAIKVLPGQVVLITVRPQLKSFWPERLLIKNADRWNVKRLAVEHRNSLLEAGPRTSTTFSLDTWHPLTAREVHCGEDVSVEVTYTGLNKDGESFEAALFGWEGDPPAKSTDRDNADRSERVSERAESSSVPGANSPVIELPLIVTSPTLFVDRLTITDAKDWIVHDIRTRGKSIFVQSGDLPGEMFSESAHVILEPLTADDRVLVLATYVGKDTTARLVVTLSGTTAPPNSPRVCSYFLPMSTGIPILPAQSAQITGRPQSNFLPERLVIADPDDWIINDIKAGIRSQLAAVGDIPGQAFSSRTVGGHVTLDPVRRSQDFIVVVTRGEDCKKGASFFCGVQGRVLQHNEHERQTETDEQLVTATEINAEANTIARRLVLPLHLPHVPPHQPTRVTARTDNAMDIHSIHISSAGTNGGAAAWVVNDIEIDGRSQLTLKDLPGALFGGNGVAAAKHATAKLSLEGFDPVERNRELALIVTYVGPNPEGAVFYAAAVGFKPPQRPTIVPIASKSPLPPITEATITARIQNAPFQMTRIEIDAGHTPGGAADWIVKDLRINGRTQFAQSGDIPGDMFASSAIDTFVKMEACEAGNAIEIDVTYIGLNESGAIFSARLEGVVTRGDYNVPPPDLNVLVETSGQGPGEFVVATCNWRAP